MRDDDLLASVIDSLAHLIAGNDQRSHTKWPKARIEAFDGFDIMTADDAMNGGVLLGDNAGDAPIWPMDARMAAISQYPGIEGCWAFKRVCTLAPRNWRGRLRVTVPKMIEHHEQIIAMDGSARGSVGAYGIINGRPVNADARNHSSGGFGVGIGEIYGGYKDDGHGIEIDVRLAHGVELRREYNWSVLIGEPGIPRARFTTDALGVREVFRLRDIPAGAARRAALRHWVRQHWRMKRDPDAADKAFVREHLRGRMEFGWQGLSCEIEPSREDIRRAAAVTRAAEGSGE